jgi:hypothetical protein
MEAPNLCNNHPIEVTNQGYLMNKFSNMAKFAKTTEEIALKVLKSLVTIVGATAICTLMALVMYGGHPIATPIGTIMGLWQGILIANKIWAE